MSITSFFSNISQITFKSMSTSTLSSNLFNFMTRTQIICFITFSINFFITSIVSIAFKSSRHHKFNIMFDTFSSNSFQISMIKHQKSHRKSHFIMNDLFEMFVEKQSKKNKNIIQKTSYFQCFFATFRFAISLFKLIK